MRHFGEPWALPIILSLLVAGCTTPPAPTQGDGDGANRSANDSSEADPSPGNGTDSQPGESEPDDQSWRPGDPIPPHCPRQPLASGTDYPRECPTPERCPGCFSSGAGDPGGTGPGGNGGNGTQTVTVERVNSTYETAPGGTSGSFRTGQPADLLLSGFGFNRTGGPLVFDHPMALASEGTVLAMTDTRNNRVLVWNTLPTGNTPPDLVLGQADFDSNDPGSGLSNMNWPVGVTIGGGKMVVSDTENRRLLVWRSVPTRSAQSADFEIAGISWPWGVWTDGNRLVATSTNEREVWFWNTFPTDGSDAPDFILEPPEFGTPRTIATDGNRIMIGDHNANVAGEAGQIAGNHFFNAFPSSASARPDFFLATPPGEGDHAFWGGGVSPQGHLIALGNTGLHIWNAWPADARDAPDVSFHAGDAQTGQVYDFGGGASGDGAGVVVAGGRLYLLLYNANKVVVYDSIPTNNTLAPDFAIGAPDIHTNTLVTNHFVTNGNPVSDGSSLFVPADFDRAMYVWKRRPNTSGAPPDLVYRFDFQPSTGAIREGKLVIAGGGVVAGWDRLPLDGELPDWTIRDRAGNATFRFLYGAEWDSSFFYLSDRSERKVYVWREPPRNGEEPLFTLSPGETWKIASDGRHLFVSALDDLAVYVYDVATLSAGSTPRAIRLPDSQQIGALGSQMAVPWKEGVIVCDSRNARLLVWNSLEDALNATLPDVVIGRETLTDYQPRIGRNGLFSPFALDFDGDYLWVGEVKFAGRILRFSPGT